MWREPCRVRVASLLAGPPPRTPARWGAVARPTIVKSALGRDRGLLLVLGVRLQDRLTDAILRRGVADRPQQREAAPLAVHRVRARGKRHVPAAARAALPDAEADQLQPFEDPVGEMEFRLGKLSGRVVLLVRGDFHDHDDSPSMAFRALVSGALDYAVTFRRYGFRWRQRTRQRRGLRRMTRCGASSGWRADVCCRAHVPRRARRSAGVNRGG